MWTIRHEGSPRAIEGLTLQQVLDGLLDGLWEPTDEVRGPGETAWLALESHPATAEVAGEVEPPPPRPADDATSLDFNALIDVCLVLLIFFILTTSYAALIKRLDMPSAADPKLAGPAHITKEQVEQQMIKVVLSRKGGVTLTQVEDKKDIPLSDVEKELRVFKRGSGRNTLLLQYDADVPFGDVIRVQDIANRLRFDEVLVLVPPEEAK